MTRELLSLEQIEPGDVLWARARGYWREVRVVSKGCRTAKVVYVIRSTTAAAASVKEQDLAPGRFRRARPFGYYGILDVPAPKMPRPAVRS